MTSMEDRLDSVTIEVEHTDRGWVVVHVVDGERKPIEPAYPDRESAEAAAAVHTATVDRWDGAASERPAQELPGD